MAEAVVEYDYKAQEPDELTIKKGDKISEIVFNDGGWWEGLLNKTGQRGMFPDNFVRLVSDPEGKATPQSAPWSGRKCKVLFNYKPGNDDELELQIGDIIDIVAEVEEGWWRGRLKNKMGVFPSNFVVELTDGKEFRETTQRKFNKTSHEETSSSHSTTSVSVSQEIVSSSSSSSKIIRDTSPAQESPLPLPPKPIKEYCKALYGYDARNADELTFQEGDLILLISKEAQDPGWWKGEFKGKVGVFPDNFVQLVTVPTDDTLTKPERPSKSVSSSGSIKSKELSKTSSLSSVNAFSINRKFSDTVKPEEKIISPPSVSKKPVLPPPPMKKPQRSSSDLSKSPTAPNVSSSAKGMDTSPTSVSSLTRNISQMSISSTTSKHSSSSSTVAEATSNASSGKWTTVENIDNTDGALWSKQSSYSVIHSSNSLNANSSSTSGVFTSSSNVGDPPDFDLVGRAAMLTHPTASRVKAPKRRPPSTIWKDGMNNGDEIPEMKDVSTPSPTSSTSSTMVNGDAEVHSDKASSRLAPWVDELKQSQAKKSMQAGKTRVMIGGETSQTISSSVSSMSSSSSVLKSEGATLTETVNKTSPMSMSMSGVTLRSTGSSVSTGSQQRPQSMMGSLRSSLGSHQASEGSVTLSAKQWSEILEKIAKVDHYNSQVEHLLKVVEKLSLGLDEARQQREAMRKELEKIANLVTQV